LVEDKSHRPFALVWKLIGKGYLNESLQYIQFNNLAWTLATHADAQIRNGAEALRLAESVVKKQGQMPTYLDTLAVAYAEVGRFPEAVATAKKAVQIATSQGDTQMAQDIQSRLTVYQSAKPWRDK